MEVVRIQQATERDLPFPPSHKNCMFIQFSYGSLPLSTTLAICTLPTVRFICESQPCIMHTCILNLEIRYRARTKAHIVFPSYQHTGAMILSLLHLQSSFDRCLKTEVDLLCIAMFIFDVLRNQKFHSAGHPNHGTLLVSEGLIQYTKTSEARFLP